MSQRKCVRDSVLGAQVALAGSESEALTLYEASLEDTANIDHPFTFDDFLDGEPVKIRATGLIHLAAARGWNDLSKRLFSDRNNGGSEIRRCNCKTDHCSWLQENKEPAKKSRDINSSENFSSMLEFLSLTTTREECYGQSPENPTECYQRNLSQLTPLHLACIFNKVEVVRTLLDDHASDDVEYVNRTDSDGHSPLAFAAFIGSTSLVELLLAKGARFTQNESSDLSPLGLAVQNGHVSVVRQFVRALSNPLSHNIQKVTSRHVYFTKQPTANCNSLLHIASVLGDAQALQSLPTSTSNETAKHSNASKWTPLHCAAIAGRVDVVTKVNEMLARQAFVSSSSVYDEPDSLGSTALHLAVRTNNSQIIPLLKGADPEKINTSGLSPLHLAAQKKGDEPLSVILETFYREHSENRDVDHVDGLGRSALHICIAAGMINKVRLLIRYGSNPWKRCRRGITAVHQLAKARIRDEDTNAEIFNLLAENSIRWQLAKRALQNASTESESYREAEHDAVIEMVCDTRYKGLNVLLFAAKVRAFSLLKVICNSEFFRSDQESDVTYLTNYATPSGDFNKNESIKPVIEYIVKSMPARDAAEILYCQPFEQLLSPYMRLHKFMCFILFLVHVTHMGLFTACTIQFDDWLRERFNDTNDTGNHDHLENSSMKPVSGYWGFLVWPCICLIGVIVKIVWRTKDAFDYYRKSEIHVSHAQYVRHCAARLFYQVQVSDLPILFFCSTIAWISWYHHCFDKRAYGVSLSLVYIIGWTYTTQFTVFMQMTSEILYAIRTILRKDVSVFFVIYGFQLLSFSLSTHILTVKEMMPKNNDVRPFMQIIYDMFARMLRSEVESKDDMFAEDTWYTYYVACVYLLYGTISAVVLVNLLIAMMGHTYEVALEQAKLDVRVDTFWVLGEIIERERHWTLVGSCLRWCLRLFAGGRWPVKRSFGGKSSPPRFFLKMKS